MSSDKQIFEQKLTDGEVADRLALVRQANRLLAEGTISKETYARALEAVTGEDWQDRLVGNIGRSRNKVREPSPKHFSR